MADAKTEKQKVKEITDKLEEGLKELFESEKYKSYLSTMSKFHNYSVGNTLLITLQKPEATLVAGFRAWQTSFNRHVKKGEKGIRILAPAPYKIKEERDKLDPVTGEVMLDKDGMPQTEEVEIKIPAFRAVSVFDVSQTDGEPIPELEAGELLSTVEGYKDFIKAITYVSPAPIGFEDIPGDSKGYFSTAENRIAVQEGMSESQTLKTMIHETAHSMLHNKEINKDDILAPAKDRNTKEVEAESIAYTVCQHFGIDTSEYSFGYIAGWSSGRDMKELKSSLDTIRRTASELITGIEGQLQEIQRDREMMQDMSINGQEKESFLLIQDSDLSEYSLVSVRGMDAAEIMETLADMNDNDRLNVAAYLESRGAWTAEIGIQETKELEGYHIDVRYNTNTNEITGLRAEMGQITEHEGISGIEKEKDLEKTDWENEKERAEGGANREAQLLYGDADQYGIYQLKDKPELHDFHFAGTGELLKRNLLSDDYKEIQPGNYNLVYTGELSDIKGQEQGEKLNVIYEKFNIDHPADYKGHSLSVSDIVVLHEDGKNSTHFVDSYGFIELPEFTKALEGVKEQDVEKTEPEEAQDIYGHDLTSGHNVQKMEDDRTEQKTDFSVYGHTMSYAAEHGEVQKYRKSRTLNRECKEAIEGTIRQNFDGMHLKNDIVKPLAEQYGSQRMAVVLAGTLRELSKDGRFSKNNQEWASKFHMPENIVQGMDISYELVVSSHPAVLDGFIDMFRREVLEQEKEVFTEYGKEQDTSGHDVQKLEPEQPDIEQADEISEFKDMEDEDEIIDLGDEREQVLSEIRKSLAGEQVTVETLETHLPKMEDNLEGMRGAVEGESVKESLYPEQAETEVTLTVAECGEFHNLGEFYENIPTVEEAVAIWKQIPSERMNGVPAIGIHIHKLGTEMMEDVAIDVLSGNRIDLGILEYVPDMKDNPQAVEVIAELVAKLPEMEIEGNISEKMEAAVWEKRMPDLAPAEQLAVELDRFIFAYDATNYHDSIRNMTENVSDLAESIHQGDTSHLTAWLSEVIAEGTEPEETKRAAELLEKLADYKPLAKIEEMEEQNYNMVLSESYFYPSILEKMLKNSVFSVKICG